MSTFPWNHPIAQMACILSVFRQIKHVVQVSFSYFTLQTHFNIVLSQLDIFFVIEKAIYNFWYISFSSIYLIFDNKKIQQTCWANCAKVLLFLSVCNLFYKFSVEICTMVISHLPGMHFKERVSPLLHLVHCIGIFLMTETVFIRPWVSKLSS